MVDMRVIYSSSIAEHIMAKYKKVFIKYDPTKNVVKRVAKKAVKKVVKKVMKKTAKAKRSR